MGNHGSTTVRRDSQKMWKQAMRINERRSRIGTLTQIKQGNRLIHGDTIYTIKCTRSSFGDAQLWTVLLMVLEVDRSVETLVAAKQE